MSERSNHKFQFSAAKIAEAANAEAEYHLQRLQHWQEREHAAYERVSATMRAKIVKHEVTGGNRYSLVVDVGDQEALHELHLAEQKIENHRQRRERFQTDAQIYGTQERAYELDTDDVHHFRLGGEQRED
jgi:hypothetical protein